jgi:hypothetical protein
VPPEPKVAGAQRVATLVGICLYVTQIGHIMTSIQGSKSCLTLIH